MKLMNYTLEINGSFFYIKAGSTHSNHFVLQRIKNIQLKVCRFAPEVF